MPLSKIIAILAADIGLDAESVGLNAIERAVKYRMTAHHLRGMEEYHALVCDSVKERAELVETVVVSETWFFRHPDAFTALKVIAAKHRTSSRPLRVLSVPCATGEEPYSIAMALTEAGLCQTHFEIDGADISARALAIARTGVFGRNSFRGSDLSWRENFFTRHDSVYRLSPQVISSVAFHQWNLLTNKFAAGKDHYDVVFCRNVLIYFDLVTQNQVIVKLGELLAPNGTLFVGPAEPGLLVRHGYASAGFPQAFAFVKAPIPDRVVVKPKKPAVKPPVSLLAARPRPPVILPKPVAAQKPANAVANLDAASRLADEGDLIQAVKMCETVLREQGASAGAYYLLGLVKDGGGKSREANEYYRKTIYLEPNHYEALMHLALLTEKAGDPRGAKVFKERAIRIKATANQK
ncbi:MAG: chemotaxis protein CheR [Verrucomicrobiales bacterium]|nr:chemotaxis protein CheR [Verrucomicrobiales bacterium]